MILYNTGGPTKFSTCLIKNDKEKKKSLPYRVSNYKIALFCIYIQQEILIIVKLPTVVEGDPKAPFPIATTLRCKKGHYSIPWIAPLYP